MKNNWVDPPESVHFFISYNFWSSCKLMPHSAAEPASHHFASVGCQGGWIKRKKDGVREKKFMSHIISCSTPALLANTISHQLSNHTVHALHYTKHDLAMATRGKGLWELVSKNLVAASEAMPKDAAMWRTGSCWSGIRQKLHPALKAFN